MKKFIAFWLSIFSLALFAKNTFISRPDVQAFIKDTHKKYGLATAYLEDNLAKVKLQKRVIKSIKNPKEAAPWRDYRKIFITSDRINKGLKFWQKNNEDLKKAEKQFGVPQEIIVAIIGVETNFGEKQGNYRVLDSLATLAFNFEKRAPFFKKELAHFLLLCKEQNIKPESIYGSYAGAIGQPQFMPSSYRAYAVDFTGNGQKDLRHSTADAIGSVGNYLSVHGWKSTQGVIEPAKIKGNNYGRFITNRKLALYSLKKLHRNGIDGQQAQDAKKGSLVALRSQNDVEYWLAYPNFFVITRYNTSEQYALAVYLLAERIKEQKSTKS